MNFSLLIFNWTNNFRKATELITNTEIIYNMLPEHIEITDAKQTAIYMA